MSESDQLNVDEIVHKVMAHDLEDAGKAIGHLVENWPGIAQVGGLIAGCTELPIALHHADLPAHLVVADSNQVLAEVLTDAYFATAATTQRS